MSPALVSDSLQELFRTPINCCIMLQHSVRSLDASFTRQIEIITCNVWQSNHFSILEHIIVVHIQQHQFLLGCYRYFASNDNIILAPVSCMKVQLSEYQQFIALGEAGCPSCIRIQRSSFQRPGFTGHQFPSIVPRLSPLKRGRAWYISSCAWHQG